MRIQRWPIVAALLSLFGCGFHETVDHGVPNLVQIAPRLWRMGQPDDAAAWDYLRTRIAPNGERVLIVKLNDDKEGDDSPAVAMGWSLLKKPIPPEDDKPWTVVVKPDPKTVRGIVDSILVAHGMGMVVAWHCSHGRDRTGLVAGLVGMRLLGWSKDAAWDDMIAHGFRWALPDIDAYWLQEVR